MNFVPASVRPICLPLGSSGKALPKSAIVAGWGSTEDGSLTSERLLKVRLPILAGDVCRRAYRDQPFVKFWHRQICSGGLEAKDSCTGDSGGPLQTIGDYRGASRYIQRGIVSFGRRSCAVKGSPGVYTDVAYYLDWILDQLEE